MRDFLSPPEAARLADVSNCTIMYWCRKQPKLGQKVGGRWRVNPEMLARVMSGVPLGQL